MCGDERQVNGKEDTDVGSGRAEAGDDSDQRRAQVVAVVVDGEGQPEPVGSLAAREPFGARGAENSPRPLGEGLAVEASQCLGRAEPAACAADQQHAG